jgi:hypothetical protein
MKTKVKTQSLAICGLGLILAESAAAWTINFSTFAPPKGQFTVVSPTVTLRRTNASGVQQPSITLTPAFTKVAAGHFTFSVVTTDANFPLSTAGSPIKFTVEYVDLNGGVWRTAEVTTPLAVTPPATPSAVTHSGLTTDHDFNQPLELDVDGKTITFGTKAPTVAGYQWNYYSATNSLTSDGIDGSSNWSWRSGPFQTERMILNSTGLVIPGSLTVAGNPVLTSAHAANFMTSSPATINVTGALTAGSLASNTATINDLLILGSGAQSGAANSLISGSGNNASYLSSNNTLLGTMNEITVGAYSFIAGSNNKSEWGYNTTIGNGNLNCSAYGVAIGNQNVLGEYVAGNNGGYITRGAVFGEGNIISNHSGASTPSNERSQWSYLIGRSNSTNKINSTVIGHGNQARNHSSVTIGIGGGAVDLFDGDATKAPVVTIGNGSPGGTLRNAIIVRKDNQIDLNGPVIVNGALSVSATLQPGDIPMGNFSN